MTARPTNQRRWYDALAYCCGFWGISAVLGGLALLADLLPFPLSLLEDSPFATYWIPGFLLTLLGGLSLACGIALPRQDRQVVLVAGALGIAQIIFMVVEYLVVGFTWLLVIYLSVALLTVAIAWRVLTLPTPAEHSPRVPRT